ncbi:MAG TPA: hypothetical protein VG078_07835 [Acidimicrobiales bacterium]|nr:hypothetical protein [Acidimicrobiales bacterium]
MTLSSPAEVARAGAPAPTSESSPRPRVERDASASVGRGSRRRFVVAFAALAAMAGAGSLTLSFLLVGAPVPAGSPSSAYGAFLPVVVAAAAVRSGLFLTAHRAERRRVRRYAEELVEATRTSLFGTAALIAFTFYWHREPTGHLRWVLLLDWVLATVASLCLAALAKRVVSAMRRQGHDVRHVVVVGASPSTAWFVASVARHPDLGYRVVRHLRTGLGPSQLQAPLVAIAAKTRVDEILFAAPAVSDDDLSGLVTVPELRHVELRVVPELFGSAPAKVRVGTVGDFPVLTLLNEPLPGVRRFFKRTIDVVLACHGAVDRRRAHAGDVDRHPDEVSRAGAVPAPAHRHGRTTVREAQVPHDGGRGRHQAP